MGRTLVVGALVFCAACGRDSTTAPTAPVPPTTPVSPVTFTTFGLVGGVYDTASRPLAQARVEVLDGPQKGAVAVTDAAGVFSFEPIFTSPVTLRGSKEGYRDESKLIASAQSARFFRLESVNGSLDLRGNYEITFTADVACTDLPAAARARTYSASLQPAGTSFYLGTLHGADFARGSASYPSWDVLYVNVFEDFAHVFFSDPPVWEHLTAESDLVIDGDANGTVRADVSRWSFAGTFAYCAEPEPDSYPECEVPEISCRAQNHQLTLTRK